MIQCVSELSEWFKPNHETIHIELVWRFKRVIHSQNVHWFAGSNSTNMTEMYSLNSFTWQTRCWHLQHQSICLPELAHNIFETFLFFKFIKTWCECHLQPIFTKPKHMQPIFTWNILFLNIDTLLWTLITVHTYPLSVARESPRGCSSPRKATGTSNLRWILSWPSLMLLLFSG